MSANVYCSAGLEVGLLPSPAGRGVSRIPQFSPAKEQPRSPSCSVEAPLRLPSTELKSPTTSGESLADDAPEDSREEPSQVAASLGGAGDVDAVSMAMLPAELRSQLEGWRAGMMEKLDATRTALACQNESVTPWTVKKHRYASQRALHELRGLGASTATILDAVYAHLESIQGKLADREQALAIQEAALNEVAVRQATALHESGGRKQALHDLRQRHEETDAVLAALLARTDALGLGESYAAKKAKGATIAADLGKAKQVSSNVERLITDLAAEKAIAVKATKARDLLAVKNKELQDKVSGVTDITEREMRKLLAEVSKAKVEAQRARDAKEVEVALARREAAEQLATKARDIKVLTMRCDAMKRAADLAASRVGAGPSTSRGGDEGGAAGSKAQERCQELERQLAASRQAQEAMAHELHQLRSLGSA